MEDAEKSQHETDWRDGDRLPMESGWSNEGKLQGQLTEKQWLILEAALQIFTEKGFSAATTSEIARKAGIAEGTIFRHFKTKKDILLAALVPLLQNFIGPRAVKSLQSVLKDKSQLPLKELLILIAEDRQKIILENNSLLRFLLTESQYHSELRDVLNKEVIYKAQEAVIGLIKQRQEKGELRRDIDAWTMTRSMMGMFFLHLISQHMFPLREEGRDTRHELEQIANLFLEGASSKQP